MTEKYKKKLIEVAIPLEAINAASSREKSIRHGHPSTLHLWWARRPLAACRAVLFAQLVDDPSSDPEHFPTPEAVAAERKRLFAIIEELVKWENSTNEEVLNKARAEIRRCCGDTLPPVYDPFSGGCSIPLEAQRLGLPAYGSDLNPVAVMIGKAMIEIPPKFKDLPPIHPGPKDRGTYRNAEGLAEDVKYYGEWMRQRAFERIGHLYPQVQIPNGVGDEGGTQPANVIAWIWARTVPSPDPAFSDEQVPLVRSFDLCAKKGKEVWVEPVIEGKKYHFEIRSKANGDVKSGISGTVNRSGGKCILSTAAMPFKYIRQQAKEGHMSARLMAIVAEGVHGRIYLPPSKEMEVIAASAKPDFIPETRICHWPGRTNVVEYGMETFGDLFTDRQLVALNTFSDLVHEARTQIEQDALAAGMQADETPLRDGGTAAKAYAEAVSVYLAFAVNRQADRGSSICTWDSSPKMEALRNTFGRQAIPMTWDFAEGNPFSKASGNFLNNVDWVQKSLKCFVPNSKGCEIQQDAQTLSIKSNALISSDPPYYDNIGYADLSDFFFCWIKPALRPVFPDIFGVLATPKGEELVATPYRHGGKEAAEDFFLNGMRKAIANMASQTSDAYPATIYYAFKQSEIDNEGISSTGWATFLQAIVEAGYAVVGTWPMRTEMSNRMIASGTNALANSVVLVCRKKSATAETITRGEFIRILKRELKPAITALQAANLSPADLPQSAIGPGMGVFSRYAAVLEADDSQMSVKTALQLINAQLDEYLNDLQGDFDADTRFAVGWFEQHGYAPGPYGDADNLARARGISVESVHHAGVIESSAGKVRVLKREEMDADWDPNTDVHFTIWEGCQHMIRLLENEGEYAAATMMKKLGSERAESVRDLTYYLYDVCDKKRKDAKEATAYNGLMAVWSELSRQAADMHEIVTGTDQMSLDL